MSSPVTTELHVTGMTCNNCARKVTDAAQKVPGVHSVAVNIASERASVRWNSEVERNAAAAVSAISAAGFTARELAESSATTFSVDGMTCNNCVRHVTEAISSIPGVRSAAVSLEGKSATVNWGSADAKNIPAVLAAVSQAGYSAKEILVAAGHPQTRWQGTLIVGLTATGLLMAGEWGLGLMMKGWFQWLSFVLAAIVQTYCGAEFYRGAWRQLRVGSSNMDTLVALGSTTAFGYSTWALLSGQGGHVYFMEAAAIISIVSFGHWLEARVNDRASGALKSLMNLAPQTARKIIPSRSSRGNEAQTKSFDLRASKFSIEQSLLTSAPAEEVETAVSDLRTGDRVALRPGDRVPVDGLVLEGESAVDEAMLTGESIPADKKPGRPLYAGTVNLNSRLVLRVTATGEATALAHIIAAVQRAQTSRADIQRLGDRISNVFVPVIVAIALAAGVFWAFHTGAEKAFVIAAGVLIIACPCAMGLATPAAIMASANAAARRGILIRDGVALEKAGKITAVIFDKTGTLTVGRPEVADSWLCSSRRKEALTYSPPMDRKPEPPQVGCYENKLAAALARHSTHPVSQAIAKVSDENVELSDWQEIRGCGVEAKLSTLNSQLSTVRLGSLRWLRECQVSLAAGEKFIAQWSAQGATIVGLAKGNELVALFAVRDALKSHSVAVVSQLQEHGLRAFLLTGDNPQTAASMARQVGIAPDNVFAEVRPEQKAEFVKKLQLQGERVAFVGDGINDAPALTQADLGIAVSRASDIAREAADIILLKSEIEAVPEALGLARATLRTIKQNLFWAFFYNALGVPLAAMGYISPVFCAAAMGFSDLIVIGNALRLLRWRR